MPMRMSKEGQVIASLMRKRAYETASPIQATFELTPQCDFNCRMCYVHIPEDKISQTGRGKELTAEQWLEIGRQAADMGVISLCITGGDPICHPEFEAIWTGLSRMGFQITLQTNASQLSKKILELLEEYPPYEVKVTLYGSNDEIYRDVCRVEKGFTRTDKGIQALKELNIPIQLVTTFIKQNKDDAQNIADYAEQNQLFSWFYSTSCYPSLRGADSEARECALDPWTLGCEDETSRLWNKGLMKEEKKPCEMCSGYRTSFDISWDGDMRFCLFLDKPNIWVLDKPLEKCWKELLVFWEESKWPDECYSCDIKKRCIRCLAHLACYSGGLSQLDSKYCRVIRRILDN